jgi:hypothetical protein
MNKLDFIEYSASRYGIDFSVAETFVDMFSSCLSELLDAGQSVDIDGIGEFEKIPLFPNGLNHQNKIALARLTKKTMISVKASEDLAV